MHPWPSVLSILAAVCLGQHLQETDIGLLHSFSFFVFVSQRRILLPQQRPHTFGSTHPSRAAPWPARLPCTRRCGQGRSVCSVYCIDNLPGGGSHTHIRIYPNVISFKACSPCPNIISPRAFSLYLRVTHVFLDPKLPGSVQMSCFPRAFSLDSNAPSSRASCPYANIFLSTASLLGREDKKIYWTATQRLSS